MKSTTWIMAVVFLAVSIPTVLLLQALEVAGDYRLLIAMGAGALASSIVQGRMAARGDKE